VLVRPASAAASAVVPPGTKVAGAGEGRAPWLHEEVAGARLRVSAGSFFQPGPVAAEALVGAVDEAIGGGLRGPGDPTGSGSGGHLLDAYTGVGLFGAVLGARHGARVTAVERSPSAAADARANLAGIDAHVLEIEVGRWRPRGAPVDVVVADPARSGLGRPGTTALARSAAPRLVLVSCDPASLARDSALLAQFGFSLSALWLVDAFPHTFHVETVARFDR
jgi:23S rRNA (uracil1939-C5)-methyltransferase